MLVTMKELLDHASRENYAVPAPNIASEMDARPIIGRRRGATLTTNPRRRLYREP